MTALSAYRSTQQRGDATVANEHDLQMKGSTTIYKGSLVMIDAGYVTPGATATGKLAAGMAMETKTNSGSSGATTIKVRTGIFKWAQSGGGDIIAQADVGKKCYITDDQTVMLTSSGKSVAGWVYQVDTDGVWVWTLGFGRDA